MTQTSHSKPWSVYVLYSDMYTCILHGYATEDEAILAAHKIEKEDEDVFATSVRKRSF